MDLFIKILGCVFIVIGAAVVYLAKFIVRGNNIAEKMKVKVNVSDEEKLKELKELKAIATVKTIGAVIFLPGIVLILIAFR